MHCESCEWSQKIHKNSESQWNDQRVVNGLRNPHTIGETNGMLNLQIVPTQVRKTENVGSLEAPLEAQVFTFGPWGQSTERVVNGLKNQQKIGEANGMPSLPIVPTQVTLRGNVGSLNAPRTSQLFTFGPWGGRVLH